MDVPSSIARIDAWAPLQQRVWRISRLGWAVMGAALALAAAGLFGDGPLAEREAGAPGGALRVTHDRFQRADATSEFELRGLGRNGDGHLVFCLDRSFLAEWRIARSEPGAIREEARGDQVCHVIRVEPSAPVPQAVRLWALPRMARLLAEGRVSEPGGGAAIVRATVWP